MDRRGLATTLRRLRDELELGALMMSGAVLQAITNWKRAKPTKRSRWERFFVPDEFVHHNFAQGLELTKKAYAEIVDSEPYDFSSSRPDLLRRQ